MQVLIVLSVFLGSILLHEAGHVIAGYLCGGTLTGVVLFSTQPHVTISGVFTPGQEAFKAAAGSGGIVALWLAARLSRTARPRGMAFDAFSWFAGVELLGWSCSILESRTEPKSNDAIRFLTATGVHPALLVAGCFALGLAGVWLYRRHRRPEPVQPEPVQRARAAAA